MANTIKIKRRPAGGSSGKPSSLYNGELAFNENDNILYYGYGSGVGGAASSIEQIGGSGYFAHRGGINASGLWPVSVTGNAGTVTNGVYTTGDQNIGGIKRFTSQVELSGNLGQYLIFKSANAGNYANIVFDGVNYDGAVQSSYISSNTGNLEIAHGTKIQLNSALEVKAANTSSNNVGYFAVFDTNPASSLTTLKSVSKSDVLDDIGGASSGISITAGSGLVGGGNLSASRTFDIGQGDGITVSADSIAVDSTVVRTTGTQTINGSKTFGNETTFTSGMVVSNQTANNLASFDANKKLASSYSVETTLTGGSTSIPRADAVKTYVDNMIVSGIATNDAMIFKGAIDCSTNPNYPAADRGWTYKVSVAGKIGGASGPTVEVNDTLICTTDETSSGTHASVGSNWIILQTNITDASILVTGPASATSGNFALFDGTTGKIIKDAGYSTIPVVNGGTGQTSYTNGQLLIGNTTGNTLTKSTLTAGTSIDITNGSGSITIGHADTSTLTGAQGGNGIAAFTLDGLGHVTAVTTATYLTAGTVCAAIVDCTLDGGSF